jgi:Cu(I)/Ag(I) efflux system membrane fusion protein
MLKPEMFATGKVKARLPGKGHALTIPKSAVMWTGERSVVYVKSESPTGVSFTMREVKLGPSLGDAFVVQGGLFEGEEVAVHGTFSIDAAAQLAGKPSMMNTAPAIGMEEMHGGEKGHSTHEHGTIEVKNGRAEQVQDDHASMQLETEIEHANFSVSGNCSMCKATIEEAAVKVPGVKTAEWNMETKQVHVTYNHEKTSLGKIHEAIAGAGYDTEKKKAPNEVYENLPECCKYTRD